MLVDVFIFLIDTSIPELSYGEMLYIFKRSGIQTKTFCQNFCFVVFICIEKALLMRTFLCQWKEISVRTPCLTVFWEKFKYHHKTKQAYNRLNARTIVELVSIFSVEE